MNNEKQYKAMFSKIQSNTEIDIENYKKKPKHYLKAGAVALICLVLGSAGVVYAFDLFELQGRVMDKQGKIGNPIMNEEIEAQLIEGETVEIPEETEYVDIITMQQAKDSDEHKATSEWLEFLDHYDQDGALLSEVGNAPTGLEEQYGCYMVYTQEMADKLEEIAAKYGLNLHTSLELAESQERLYELAGVEPFIGERNICRGGYVYEDGSFQYDGEMITTDQKTIMFQLRSSRAGTLDEVALNIGSAEDYEERVYQTQSGFAASVATSQDKVIIAVPLEQTTVTINVLLDLSKEQEDYEYTEENINEIIDSIDFEKLNMVS